MRKILILALAVSIVLAGIAGVQAPVPASASRGGSVYYVSEGGVGGNDGLSKDRPFPSVNNVDWNSLEPGDQVLLERGSEFSGFIRLNGVSGTAESPIKIGVYGDEQAAAPRINAKGQGIWFQDYGAPIQDASAKYRGYVSSAILLYDCDFIEIRGLEITNSVPYDEEAVLFDTVPNGNEADAARAGIMDRAGVSVVAKDGGTSEHIYLDGLFVHDVDSNLSDKFMSSGGVQFNALRPTDESSTGVARFADVRVENSFIKDVSQAGIRLGYTYNWQKFLGDQITDETASAFCHEGVVIRNNYVKGAGTDSVAVMYAAAPVVEGNVSDGALSGSAFQAWKCKNAIVQYNEAFGGGAVNAVGSEAFASENADGAVFQYNYSHDNAQGALAFRGAGSLNGVFRYNLSYNDRGSFVSLQDNPVAAVYNNVFYVGAAAKSSVLNADGAKTTGAATFNNNVFFNDGGEVAANWAGSAANVKSYANNLYYGFGALTNGDFTAVNVSSENRANVFAGEDLIAPAAPQASGLAHGNASGAFDAFKLKEGSPAINAGVPIVQNGGKDFFGNSLDATPDIGAYDTRGAMTGMFSAVYPIDNIARTVSKIPPTHTVAQFKANISIDVGFSLAVADRNGVALQDSDLIDIMGFATLVGAGESIKYSFVPDDDNRIIDSLFEIDGQTIKVPLAGASQTTAGSVLSGIFAADTATVKVLSQGGAELAAGDGITAGAKIVVTALNGVANEYAIEVKNAYDYVDDFRDNAQGAVWFAQAQTSAGVYENLTSWQQEWRCWGDYAAPYRSVGLDGDSGKGLLCDSMAAAVSRAELSHAMAFRAPVGGVLELSFPVMPQLRRSQTLGSTRFIISINGETLGGREYVVPNDASKALSISPFAVEVEQGDYIRFEAKNIDNANNSSFWVTPAISYVDAVPAISSDVYNVSESLKKIENVPYNTIKANLLAAIDARDGVSITLVGSDSDAEIADGTPVTSGMRIMAASAGSPAVYYTIVVLPKETVYADYDRSGWTAFAGSSQPLYAGVEGPANLVLDGSDNTRWHTIWDGVNSQIQELAWIAIDMKEPLEVGRIGYVARPSQNAGNYYSYVVERSDNGTDWTFVASGDWDKAVMDGPRGVVHYAVFEPVTTQYIRLRATVSDESRGCAAEITVGAAEKEPTQDETYGKAPAPHNPIPNEAQLYYHEQEMAGFIHFGINTFNEVEWGTGKEDVGVFNPTNLNQDTVESWVRQFKDAGFKRLMFVAKHHDGFCLWDSAYTEQKITNSPYGEDLLEQLSVACTKLDMDMGFYLSPWDMNNKYYGATADPDASDGIADYNDYYMKQLVEVLSNPKYGNDGKFVEVWMDGAKGSGVVQEYNFDEWFDAIHEYQPDCLIYTDRADGGIRWSGNELGTTGDPSWQKMDSGTVTIDGIPTPNMLIPWKTGDARRIHGLPNGSFWSVCECDVSLRNGWFYDADDNPRSLESLTSMYLQSVGYGSPFLLNVPPDKTGAFSAEDSARLKEFGEAVTGSLKEDLVLQDGVTATAEAFRFSEDDANRFDAMKVVDGDPDTYWTTDPGQRTGSFTVNLGRTQTFDLVSIKEYIPLGQRIAGAKIEYRDGDADEWKPFGSPTGAVTTIGARRLVRDYPVSADQLRISVTSSQDVPLISEVGVFKAAAGLEKPGGMPAGLKYVDDREFSRTGTFSEYNNSDGYLNTHTGTGTAGRKLTATFTGSKFWGMAIKDPGHGPVKVTVDGVEMATVDTNSASRATMQVIYESPDLAYGEHTVVFECLSGPRTYLDFDGIYVLDNAGAGMFEIQYPNYAVNENGGAADVTVKRAGGSSGAAGVTVGTLPGTAVQGQHYENMLQTLAFADGETEKTVQVKAIDNSDTGGKSFSVAISAPTGGAIIGFNKEAAIEIIDDESDAPQKPVGATYTAQDPFMLPSTPGAEAMAEGEHFRLAPGPNVGNNYVRIENDSNASGGKVAGWMEPGNSVFLAYDAPKAGVYGVTLHYKSGRTAANPNWINWRGENIETGYVVAERTVDLPTTLGTMTFEITVNAQGAGELEIFADSHGGVNMDWFKFAFLREADQEPHTVSFDSMGGWGGGAAGGGGEARAYGLSNTYYVSQLRGSDSFDGLSEAKPFYSLDKINEMLLEPGDKVLLERGSVFENQYIHVNGSGSEGLPIVFDAYGDGEKPLINTNGAGVWYQNYGQPLDNSNHVWRGYVSSCILINDKEYVEISNIAMTNWGGENDGAVVAGESGYSANAAVGSYTWGSKMNRTGVAVMTKNIGAADHIYLKNLDIENVYGNIYDKHMNNGGIYFTVGIPSDEEATGISKFNDVLIEGCYLNRVSRWGIALAYTAYWKHFQGRSISDSTSETYGATGVIIRGNYLENVGGDPLTLMYAHRPLIEYNVAHLGAREISNYYHNDSSKVNRGTVAAGIWPWKSKTPVFQFNECYDMQNATSGNGDAQAWDADWGDSAVYQYNYSSGNTGGAIMFCMGESYNTVFRYNVSYNDGVRTGVLNTTSAPNGKYYNNTFLIPATARIIRTGMTGGNPVLENNIFHSMNDSPKSDNFKNGTPNARYDNNLYSNFDAATVNTAADANGITSDAASLFADPAFTNAPTEPKTRVKGEGRETYGWTHDWANDFNMFRLAENSPAIGAGKDISLSNGLAADHGVFDAPTDFYGTALEGTSDIGAHDTGAVSLNLRSSVYPISGETIQVPDGAGLTVAGLLETLSSDAGTTIAVLTADSQPTADGDVVEAGMKVVVSDGAGNSKTYTLATVAAKITYSHYDDFIGNQQGPTWYYERKPVATGAYEQFTSWNGDGWWGGASPDYTSAERIGACADVTAENVRKYLSSSIGFKAPRTGSVSVGFTEAPKSRVSYNPDAGTTINIVMTKNGESIPGQDFQIPGDGSAVEIPAFDLDVQEGDMIRFEIVNRGAPALSGNGGVRMYPVVTYQEATPPQDTEAPSAPGGLAATEIGEMSARLSWTASEDDSGVIAKYAVEVTKTSDGTVAKSFETKGLDAAVDGLEAETAYSFKVIAYDEAGNFAESETASFATLPATIPTIPVATYGVGASEKTRFGEKAIYTISAKDLYRTNFIEVTVSLDAQELSTDAAAAVVTGLGEFELFQTPIWTSLGNGRWVCRFILGALGGKLASGDADVATIGLDAVKNGEATLTLESVLANGIDVVDGEDMSVARELAIDPASAVTRVLDRYDVNGDGRVDMADLSLAFYYYQSREGDANWADASAADVDGSGVVNMTDLLAVYANVIE